MESSVRPGPSSASTRAATTSTGAPVEVDSGTATEGLTATIGSTTFVLPSGSRVDDRPSPQSALVVESSTWLIPDLTTLNLIVQNVEPLIPGKTHSIVVAGDVQWALYDIGAQNGSEVAGAAKIDGGWLLIILQQSSFDPSEAGWTALEKILSTAKELDGLSNRSRFS